MKVEIKKKGVTKCHSEVPEGMPSDDQVLSMRENDYITYVDGKVYNPSKKKKKEDE